MISSFNSYGYLIYFLACLAHISCAQEYPPAQSVVCPDKNRLCALIQLYKKNADIKKQALSLAHRLVAIGPTQPGLIPFCISMFFGSNQHDHPQLTVHHPSYIYPPITYTHYPCKKSPHKEPAACVHEVYLNTEAGTGDYLPLSILALAAIRLQKDVFGMMPIHEVLLYMPGFLGKTYRKMFNILPSPLHQSLSLPGPGAYTVLSKSSVQLDEIIVPVASQSNNTVKEFLSLWHRTVIVERASQGKYYLYLDYAMTDHDQLAVFKSPMSNREMLAAFASYPDSLLAWRKRYVLEDTSTNLLDMLLTQAVKKTI